MKPPIHLDGVPAPLVVKRVARARRLRLRVDVRDGSPVLIVPPRVSLKQGLAFAESHAAWLRARLDALPPRVPFTAGSVVPIEGVPHLLAQDTADAWSVRLEDQTIHIGGPPHRFARILVTWLKRRAREKIAAQARAMAQRIGRTIGKITLRDPHSRWGSCSRRGDLSFSWRLILAPPAVLTYVVAHEVGHLVEMNHTRSFWRVVAELAPDHAAAQAWLTRHGADLHRLG